MAQLTHPRVTIVGAGWAGLAAGVELTSHGIEVDILDAAPHIGGRARSVHHKGHIFDNGQHLLIGAYHETLRLMQQCGADPALLLQRSALQLYYLQPPTESAPSRQISIPPWLPAPLHMLWGILTARGFSLRCRLELTRASLRFSLWGYRPPHEQPLLSLLTALGQSAKTIQLFWEPLVLATLNTPIHLASATLFLRVLQDSFSHHNRDSNSLLPRQGLSQIFPQPAQRYIEQHGGTIRTKTKVSQLLIDHHQLNGLIVNGHIHKSQHLIIATPPYVTQRLLPSNTSLMALHRQLQGLSYQPIITLYLTYPIQGPLLPHPMCGLHGSLSQWLFDGGLNGQPGVLAVVVSAHGVHCDWSHEQLLQHIQGEVQTLLPHLPPAVAHQIVWEKRATFCSHAGVNDYRPSSQTPIKGLYLAGDYIDTGYPATLEGAVRSGVASARKIIDNITHP